MKPNKTVRPLPFALILPLCWSLVSCSRHQLPPIKDAELLRKDCALLFEQFPVTELSTNDPDYDYQHSLGFRIIPQTNWPQAIRALNPHLVCTYQGGIQFWITVLPFSKQGKFWDGYYVAVQPGIPFPPPAVTNHFEFAATTNQGIYLLKQSKF